MYEIILILSLIVTASLSSNSEYQNRYSLEMQNADRYLDTSNARQFEENRPDRQLQYGSEVHLNGENKRRNYPGQDTSKIDIALQVQPITRGVIKPRTDNYEHRLRTNAPPLARVPLHRQQAGFMQRGNEYKQILEEDISSRRNIDREDFSQQEKRITQNEPNQGQLTRSHQPYGNKNNDFSQDDNFSIENTTPTYKDTYEGIQDSLTSTEEKTNVGNHGNQGYPLQTRNQSSNTYNNQNAEPSREEQRFDLPHKSEGQTNDSGPQKIPRRNFTLGYTETNRHTPLQNPTKPDRTGSIYMNNYPAQTVQTVRNGVKNNQDDQRNQTNQPNKNQGHLEDNDESKNDNLYKVRDDNSFSRTTERTNQQNSSSNYSNILDKNRPTDSKQDREPISSMGETEEKWIWDGGNPVTPKVTTPSTNVVTVDDRANFAADKCATGMIRLAGKCVTTEKDYSADE